MTVRMGERGRFVRRVAGTTLDRSGAEEVMRHALAAAAATNPHPNPRVAAAIITPDGRQIALGVHERPGEPHAERLAISGDTFPGHTMVVTLEPCAHTGRTPPCTDAIIEAGFDEVWVGVLDPDDRVSGRGVEALRASGVTVHVGLLADEVEAIDPGYFHHRRVGRARTTLKLATTLDGNAAAADGSSRWITGESAREDVHRLRAAHDAVMVGAGTVIADDPRLDVRIPGYVGTQPRPVVITGGRPLPPEALVLARNPLLYPGRSERALSGILEELPDEGVLSVLVEGGPTLASSLMHEGLVDEIVWYLGAKVGVGTGLPALAGVWETLPDAVDIDVTSVIRLGDDIRITATPKGAS